MRRQLSGLTVGMVMIVLGIICTTAAAEWSPPPPPPAPTPPVGRWGVEPLKIGGITAGNFEAHLNGKNLVAAPLSVTLAAPRGYYQEEICPFSVTTTMEVVAPFTIQWRQMNGPYYHERITYWSSDNHWAKLRTTDGATYPAKLGIFFPGNWNVNGNGKRATPGIQVEFASGCFYQAKLHRIR
jgi:hypothetical protein